MTVTGQVFPYALRSDWFCIEPHQAQSIGHASGVQKDEKNNVWICHRSHLPLLGLVPPTNGTSRKVDQIVFGDGTTKLRPHQRVGVEFMLQRRGTLLADAMRVGKTPQVVATHDPNSGSLIVCAPLATRSVWLDWFKRRWPDETPLVLEGRDYSRIVDSKLIFLHYDVLVDWQSIGLREIGTLVFDEAHKLSNRKSRRTQAALIMAPQAHRVICATGTPLWNKPEGLYPLLNICGGGGGWGTYSEFTERYAGGHLGQRGWVTGDAENVDEIRTRLSEVMLRRVWAELAEDLEPTVRKVERQDITEKEEYDLNKLAAAMASGSDGRTVIGDAARYRRLVGMIKAPMAAEIARAESAKGPVVVWVWHKRVADRIAALLDGWIPTWIINGDTPEGNREAMLDAWRASEDGVLIMSLGVGQAGIDLSASSRCVFAELDWTPAVIGQAEMRTFSPTRPDTVTYVVADHDIDYQLACCLAAKCQQALLLGTPAADTAIDTIGQVLRGDVPNEADLVGLAAKLVARVQQQGTTFA